MKCNEINFIEYIEGRASEKTEAHIKECRKCQKESVKFSRFVNLITPMWAAGRALEAELDRDLQSMDPRKMKYLPDTISKKVTELRERSIVGKLKRVLGRGKENAQELIDGIMSPRAHAVPASPADLTKTGKPKGKKAPIRKKGPESK
ncbi:MAG: hypothetical protein C0392_10245 [Syntrophus sp. (in: bacteria)]|nr:hypothetical protein [Syntrophus sp. (in: bacteria)]